MATIPAQEIKRRGISAVDDAVAREPVHIIKHNRPQYVVLREEDYAMLVQDLADARLAASESDWRQGRVTRGGAADLLRELAAAGDV